MQAPRTTDAIPRDSFTSACAQACPTEAIVFGDIKDPESRVSKMKEQNRNYRLLEYLNVNTRTSYLARIRNPNPKMPDAHEIGVASPTEEEESERKKHEQLQSGGAFMNGDGRSSDARTLDARSVGPEQAQLQLDHGTHRRCERRHDAALVVGFVRGHRADRGDRFVLSRLPDFHRRWRVGIESPGRLGLGHHQLRFLDRYRTRRHAHLRDSIFAPAKMAHVDQPFRGSDDACSR